MESGNVYFEKAQKEIYALLIIILVLIAVSFTKYSSFIFIDPIFFLGIPLYLAHITSQKFPLLSLVFLGLVGLLLGLMFRTFPMEFYYGDINSIEFIWMTYE